MGICIEAWHTHETIQILLLPITLLGIVAFNIYHIPPQFQLKQLYIPALDKSITTSTDASISFHFSLTAYGFHSHIHYDPINVTFYDSPNHDNSIAIFTIPEFDQEVNSEVDYSGVVNATGLDLKAAKREIATNGFKVFRVELETSVRYGCFVFWQTGPLRYRTGVDVKIADTGAANFGTNILLWFIVAFVVFLFLLIAGLIFYLWK